MADGKKRATGTTLDARPAMRATLSLVGFKRAPDRSEDMPKTAPLCNSNPVEPWKSINAPNVVCTGVNISWLYRE